LEVWVAVRECISKSRVVCEQGEESVMAAVSVTHCLPSKWKVEGRIEVTIEVDCPLLDMA
jgi:hypothetical protein